MPSANYNDRSYDTAQDDNYGQGKDDWAEFIKAILQVWVGCY